MVVIHFWVQPVPKVGHLEILMNLIKTTIIDKKKGSCSLITMKRSFVEMPRSPSTEYRSAQWERHLGVDLRPPSTAGAPGNNSCQKIHAFTTHQRPSCVSLMIRICQLREREVENEKRAEMEEERGGECGKRSKIFGPNKSQHQVVLHRLHSPH